MDLSLQSTSLKLAAGTFFSKVGGDVERGEPSLAAQLPQVDVARGELVDQLQVPMFSGDVDRGVAHLSRWRDE